MAPLALMLRLGVVRTRPTARIATSAPLARWCWKAGYWRDGKSATPCWAPAICTAFAGPLLAKCNAESGGPANLIAPVLSAKAAHWQRHAAYGAAPTYKRTWRATSNGLESVAAGLNDCLLALDEISECDPKDVGPTVYMLGKRHALNVPGVYSLQRGPRVSVLSNGEPSRTACRRGHVIKAGRKCGSLTCHAATESTGVWDTLHHHPDARAHFLTPSRPWQKSITGTQPAPL